MLAYSITGVCTYGRGGTIWRTIATVCVCTLLRKTGLCRKLRPSVRTTNAETPMAPPIARPHQHRINARRIVSCCGTHMCVLRSALICYNINMRSLHMCVTMCTHTPRACVVLHHNHYEFKWVPGVLRFKFLRVCLREHVSHIRAYFVVYNNDLCCMHPLHTSTHDRVLRATCTNKRGWRFVCTCKS